MDKFTAYLKSQYGLTSNQLSKMKIMPADLNNSKIKAQNAKSKSYKYVQNDAAAGYLGGRKFHPDVRRYF